MSGAAFTIQSLRVEGFKAFGAPQAFELGGHVFVFGRNGLGKSSIVEAVRWCLFGLRDRPEAEARNVFYKAGECRVELGMEGPGGRWRIQRRLRPGASRSRQEIRDPSDKVVPLSKVFPHIARLGPHAGTHVIFASQQSTRRRPQADITDFDKVLYSYLQIDDVPDLLDRLDEVIEDEEQIERRLAEKVDDAEESVRSLIGQLRVRMDEILLDQPWPGATVPTDAKTDARIRAFVAECGGSVERADEGDVTREWLVRQAKQAIVELSAETEEATRHQLDAARTDHQELVTALATLEDLSDQLRAAEITIESAEDVLRDALGNTTEQQLREERDQLVLQGNESERRLALVRQAAGYFEEFAPAKCPVCDTVINPGDALRLLESRIGSDSAAGIDDALTHVEKRLAKVTAAKVDLERAKRAYTSIESSVAKAQTEVQGLLKSADLSSADHTVGRLRERVQHLERELDESGSLVATKRKRLKRLLAEVRFQQHRSRVEGLRQNLESGLEPAREAHREFVEVLESLHTIREALQESFNSSLNRTLPQINDLMTEVYGRLTQQASFPMIVVESGPLEERRRLRVSVSSDRTPGESFEPSEVLNGQAFNALNLVPYFVFSQFQAEALELDCLLIDDPSQSFDTSRVELLMRELATAGTHAQLIVASHEEDRFAPLVKRYFQPDSYRVLRVTSFALELGPTLERIE